jgi:DNA-binding FadR family transcriptional regulator
MGETMRHMLTYSEETFEHFKTARLVFEKEMTRMASLARQPARIAQLRQIVSQMNAARAQREEWRERRQVPDPLAFEPDTFMRLDGEFHKTIAAMSGNPVLAALGGALFDWLAYFHLSRLRSPGLERLVIEEHGRIVDALEAGDSDLAVGRMAEHLNRANAMYQQGQQGGDSPADVILQLQ